MQSHMHGVPAPFDLHDGIVYFHDWRYVSHGGYGWQDTEGQYVPMFGTGPHERMVYSPQDTPFGIELVARPAEKTGPVVEAESFDDLFIYGGSLIHDEGIYRLWVEGWATSQLGQPRGDIYNHLRYLESDDGMSWRAPALDLLEPAGKGPNNLVYGYPLNARFGSHGIGIFKDPAGPAAERYKLLGLGWIGKEDRDAYLQKRPDAVDPISLGEESAHGIVGAVSPDGLHWTALPEPLLLQNSDTHNVCEYDPVRGAYVAYVRTWFFMRRTIGRTESADFRRFPLPEETLWPGPSMAPYDLWYVNAKTKMPGTRDYHLMFPMRWRLTNDEFSFHLASSPDNVVWSLLPGDPVCGPGAPGAWDGGTTAPGLGLVQLPGDRIGLLYCGTRTPHKHPRRVPYGKLGWAVWPKGRLVALRAAEYGEFRLQPLRVKGRTARLNFTASIGGLVQVEVIGADGAPVPGRSFADCDPLTGDEPDREVTWRGQPHLGILDDQPVELRFRLRSAELYAVRFV